VLVFDLTTLFNLRQNRGAQSAQAGNGGTEQVLSTFQICLISEAIELFWISQNDWERENGSMLVRKRFPYT
jgi:hypothetical protein